MEILKLMAAAWMITFGATIVLSVIALSVQKLREKRL